ncbi:D-alanyl-D-alanine carboxypeptidase/D-alanyl-D-alanine-endopeptidase (penicillin-binding protein 4) [Yoonia maricola]|uniref:D-alanyl-D-alanine carboxypeptidase/D-alanyl-D-alanine-endopeptidase (Penicillin-binding protein 4) n=1 Tax=Yoonia maricola TaxID=420999 RepID=A0A2M8W2X9_9RHOB|nr:D-alanyl-D-alanine carboxypeptidase/D-alanyl-D-alanine-endopeptidase [Yoonia maricola]PJI85283.1 D-alanyl-D-alanine carboxypeptidase/D-alanyl-D-alanine-endopeptidase (penicillin-binding protein 4) [Yoonia maricola]
MRLSRRAMLSGAASTIATTAFAEAPLTSLRPIARTPAKDAIARLVANKGFSGDFGVVVADLQTGEVLEDLDSSKPQPPASVTKAFTALYAVEALGAGHVFETRIFAEGRIENGILDGNLILAGGGDPNLVTDQIAELARRLKETGLREVRGDFLVWDNALVNQDEIDETQFDHLGYNPTITGLNLNFNRVHFEWKREGTNYVTTMDARSANYRPEVTMAQIRVVDRTLPVFTYRDLGNTDQWTVAGSALNNAGSRWLPVRHPALYAGEVFAIFARSHGIVLKVPKETPVAPSGTPLASFESASLRDVMRGMLRFSTNLTAEAAGMAATAARAGVPRGLRTSALGMSRWANARAGGILPSFVDHSGLGDQSRVSPSDIVQLLRAPDVMQVLRPIMRDIDLVGEDRQVINDPAVSVKAKTGTLNFVSSLSGYLRTKNGRDLAFAFFASDLDAREAGKRSGAESPPGARGWNRRARQLQQDILRHLAFRLT